MLYYVGYFFLLIGVLLFWLAGLRIIHQYDIRAVSEVSPRHDRLETGMSQSRTAVFRRLYGRSGHARPVY